MEPDSEEADRALELRAVELVRAVLESAESALRPAPVPEREQSGPRISDIEWVSCGEFTVERGRTQIEEFIRTWELDPSWLFTVRFLRERDLPLHRELVYRAVFSLPTRRSPVSAQTAAVVFTVLSHTNRPPSHPVQVHFTIETSRTLHQPGLTRVREQWLKDVIESKARLLDTVGF
ncbi:A-kinase anchor protein 14 [Hoplias malabaricus]|uniref:A-kinase anchor protein 14 n=1 Tax=Hoplias malabaricus TaxID=27720 RepID=UPI0034625194